MMSCSSKLMDASQKRWVMCAWSGLDRDEGSLARRVVVVVAAAVIVVVFFQRRYTKDRLTIQMHHVTNNNNAILFRSLRLKDTIFDFSRGRRSTRHCIFPHYN